mmetsp:Transcript_10134/g.25301  ORF Transcript_10134/g.25301 Transcript_10134/m.25301 type:complete len:245 (-) Transcript_10134:468-1202(-)
MRPKGIRLGEFRQLRSVEDRGGACCWAVGDQVLQLRELLHGLMHRLGGHLRMTLQWDHPRRHPGRCCCMLHLQLGVAGHPVQPLVGRRGARPDRRYDFLLDEWQRLHHPLTDAPAGHPRHARMRKVQPRCRCRCGRARIWRKGPRRVQIHARMLRRNRRRRRPLLLLHQRRETPAGRRARAGFEARRALPLLFRGAGRPHFERRVLSSVLELVCALLVSSNPGLLPPLEYFLALAAGIARLVGP